MLSGIVMLILEALSHCSPTVPSARNPAALKGATRVHMCARGVGVQCKDRTISLMVSRERGAPPRSYAAPYSDNPAVRLPHYSDVRAKARTGERPWHWFARYPPVWI